MLRAFLTLCFMMFCLGATRPAAAGDFSVFTLWPLLDYRADSDVNYRSLHVFGPLFKSERKGEESETALRPLFYRAADEEKSSQLEILYPSFSYKAGPETTRFNVLHLLSYDSNSAGESGNDEFYLFPLLFYGSDREQGDYFGVFPIGGEIKGWFGRDLIRFTLFPLYSRTQKGTRRVDNVLWPFFAKIRGENESGYKFWPLAGHSQKTGVYTKSFFLWPIFFSEDLALDTDAPVHKKAVWPFFLSTESPNRSYRGFLWPFFSWRQDRSRSFTEWDLPWPLVRITQGKTRHGFRFLPFYADETLEAQRKRWYVWPVYKIEETRTEKIQRCRHRVLFFLYSDITETQAGKQGEKRRVDLWPLFSYTRAQGVSSLHVFSLLEPFFPGNDGIERGWAPLWRIYQQKWDTDGNRIVSLLWNLYWMEKRRDALAWELFPLVEYQRDASADVKLRFLKGLIDYHASPDGSSLKLLYLPWGLSWGKAPAVTGRVDF